MNYAARVITTVAVIEPVLELSLLDNEIKRKGQGPKTTRQQNPTKPQTNTQKTNKQVPGQSSKRWNQMKQAQALTANYNPRLSQ